jgi:hypothetical protein
MSESEHNAILNALNTIQKANDTSHGDIKELLNMGMKGLQLKMDADNNVISSAIVNLTTEIREHNSRLKKVEIVQDERKEVVADFKRMKRTFVNLKKRWIFILSGLILLIVIVDFLADIEILSIQRVLTYIWDKIF